MTKLISTLIAFLDSEDMVRYDLPCDSKTEFSGESSLQQVPVATYSDMLFSFATVDCNIFVAVFFVILLYKNDVWILLMSTLDLVVYLQA